MYFIKYNDININNSFIALSDVNYQIHIFYAFVNVGNVIC